MIKKYLLLSASLCWSILHAQCPVTPLSGNQVISSNTSWSAGTYNISGDFTVNAGVTLTITGNNNCPFTVNANNINIQGSIIADGAGGTGGTGGGGGSSSGGPGGGSEAAGGSAGTGGQGTGGGAAGNNGGDASGGCSIDCGFICIDGNDADRAGGGGAGGGAGGSYGGAGGGGGAGAAGRDENEPGNSDCGNGMTVGGGGGGNGAAAIYGTGTNQSDLAVGSGGGGGGGGGGGYTDGTGGANGGNGGGAVNLNASGNLVMAGVISANGTNGDVGGNGGVRSGTLANWNCEDCNNNDGGGANDCRDASLCGICTYYTWGWPGGAGGGSGGGSGGAIKLQAIGIMTVTGSMAANGGNAGNAGRPWQTLDGNCNQMAYAGGPGAGGIIKYVYNPCAPNLFTPANLVANAGSTGTNSDGNIATNTAGNGIIYDQNSNIYYSGYTVFTTPTISSSQSVCNGSTASDLTSAGITGGTGSYTYQWYVSTSTGVGQIGSSPNPAAGWTAVTGGNGASLASALIGNVTTTTYYQLQVQSGPCYVWSNVVTLSVNPLPVITNVAVTNVLCNGGNTGSLTVTASSGLPAYNYSDDGGNTYQSTNVFSGLPADTFDVYVKDANGCVAAYAVNPVTVTQPQPLVQTDTGTSASCLNVSNGTVISNASGGTQPYSYSVNGGTSQFSNIFNGLAGGVYYVKVTDANGCSNTQQVTLANAYTVADTLASATNVSCYGGDDGTATVQPIGGLPPFTYSINGLGTQSSPTFTGLSAGNYLITSSDINGCIATVTVQIGQPALLEVQIDSLVNVGCYDSAQGSIYVSVTGGTPGYTYRWSNGDTAQVAANLAAGTYNVTVVDAHGCNSSAGTSVQQPQQLFSFVASYHNLRCNGDSSGSIETSVAGGTPPYSFMWSNGSTFENIYGLIQGKYFLTVTDANGCMANLVDSVSQPSPLAVNMILNAVTCPGAMNGGASATVSGGTPGYNFAWSNGNTTSTLSNVSGGNYVLTVTDANGCSAVSVADVVEAPPIAIAGTVTTPKCNGLATGSINITVTGGTPAYTYTWLPSGSSQNLTAVLAGSYTLTVTDNNGCTATDSFYISQPAALVASLAKTSPLCYNSYTGTIVAIVNGGVEPYSFLWSGGQTSATLDSLPGGNYSLTVTDANNCSTGDNVILNQPDTLTVTPLVNGARCFNTASGQEVTTVTGGTAPYAYLVNGIQQLNDTFNNLTPGNYAVLVIDAHGCQGTSTFRVASPGQISVSLAASDYYILTGMETQLLANATADTAILNYIWSPITIDSADVFVYNCSDTSNCAAPYVKPPFTTTFTVMAMSADSCYASDTVTINVEDQPVSFVPTAFTPNGDGLNDRFEFSILGANTIEVSIFNRWGERVYYNANQTNGITNTDGWDGTDKGKPAPEGTYVYQLKITYFDGTVKNKSGTVAVMR